MPLLSAQTLHAAIASDPNTIQAISSAVGFPSEDVSQCLNEVTNHSDHSSDIITTNNHVPLPSLSSVYTAISSSKSIIESLSRELHCPSNDIELSILSLLDGSNTGINWHLFSLPNDTLVHIFTFLTLRNLSSLDQAVCNSNDRLVYLSTIRTEDLTFRCDKSRWTNDSFFQWIRSRHVNPSNIPFSDDKEGILERMQAHVRGMDDSTLRSLKEISFNLLGRDESFISLDDTLEVIDTKCSSLTELTLDSMRVTTRPLEADRFQKSRNRIHTLTAQMSTIEKLYGFPELETFYLIFCSFGPQATAGIKLPNLITLHVVENFLLEDSNAGLRFSDEYFRDIVCESNNIQTITLTACRLLTEVGLTSQLARLHSLKTIEMDLLENALKWKNIMVILLNNCPQLSSIRISNKDINGGQNSEDCSNVISAFRQYGSNLRSLVLMGGIKLRSIIVGSIFTYCIQLETLDFEASEPFNRMHFPSHKLINLSALHCSYSDNRSMQLLLSRVPSLIAFCTKNLVDVSSNNIYDILARYPTLERLNIPAVSLSRRDAAAINKMSTNLKNLTLTIDINFTFFRQIASMFSTIQYLDFSLQEGEQDFASIIDTLCGLTRLEKIFIRKCPDFNDYSLLSRLIQSLKRLTKMRIPLRCNCGLNNTYECFECEKVHMSACVDLNVQLSNSERKFLTFCYLMTMHMWIFFDK